MRLLFTLLFAVGLGALAVWLLPVLQGYVLIRTGGMAVETSVLVLLAIVFGSVALIHATVWLWNLPGNVVRSHLERRAQAQLELGMLALSEGDWARAEKALRLSARKSSDPAMHYLAAAKAAAQGSGREEQIENYLAKADESTRAQHPVAVTRAQLLLAAGDPAAALEILEGVRRPRDNRPKVLELLARCYERLERWHDLAGLVPELEKHQLIEAGHGQRIRKLSLGERMDQTSDMGELTKIWQSLSRSDRQDSELLGEYVENAIKLGQGNGVEKVVRQALNRQWSDRLVAYYGQLGDDNAPGRLKQAEKWLANHPDNAVLHLTLARLCVVCQLWGKAREHFETSISLQPMAEAHQELGDLLARDGDAEAALACYRKAVDRLRTTEGNSLAAPKT